MKTTFIQKLSSLVLSVFALTSYAQCPSITGLNVTQGSTATTTIVPTLSGTVSASHTTYYWQIAPAATVISSPAMSTGYINFPSNGTYTVCLQYVDSASMCSGYTCTLVTITSSTVNPGCNAGFISSTDTSCITHFVSTSTGSNLTYQWYDMAGYTLLSTQQNPNLTLSTGNHNISLYVYSNGQFCDSATTAVNVTCTSTASTSCNAAFTFSTDSNCVTHFINTSTGSNLTYKWRNLSSGFALLSTQQSPYLTLGQGTHQIALYVYSAGQFCDSLPASVYVNCSTLGSCHSNSQFSVFEDSLHAGNYFAYNQSSGTGTLSYLWNFGDGNTSTQAYPFHQYATPGHYIICLTVTATSATLTCSDTYCDSSSVQRIASGHLISRLEVLPQTPTGIKEQQTATILKVYPNPVENELTVEVQTEQNEGQLNYTLTDALGKIVLKNNLTSSKTTISTSDLDKGIYFLSVSQNNKNIKTIKLVKSR